MESDSNNFAFVLGRERDLALFELEAVLFRMGLKADIYKISGNIALAKIDGFSDEASRELILQLAGTTKIFRIKNQGSRINSDSGNIQAELLEILEQQSFRDFGISSYVKSLDAKEVNALGLGLKSQLKNKGISSRFVALADGNALSTIQTLKNKLDGEGVELGIFEDGIGLLVALNNPEEWAMFDYEKPASDKFSGMLPPRLARTMINLAMGQIQKQESRIKNQATVLVDPFCGSGNVLVEGLRLGLPVIGSDISEKAVRDSLENCRWYNSNFDKGNYFVFQADASVKTLNSNLKSRAGDKNLVFVGEPYLGKPKKQKDSLRAIVKEYEPIKKLYLDFLSNIQELNPVLCLVFPRVETKDKGPYSLYSSCVDEIEKLGYTQIRSPFIYGRDYQIVKREIVLLKSK